MIAIQLHLDRFIVPSVWVRVQYYVNDVTYMTHDDVIATSYGMVEFRLYSDKV